MTKITFDNAKIKPIELDAGTPLIEALLLRDVNPKMLCGRRGICATCHVYVDEGIDSLSEPSSREKMVLLMLTGATPNSRLSCQAKCQGGSVKVRMPEGLYVESFSELEKLVGQRTLVPILHPVTGDILVEANKIIVRSIIMKLADTDFTVDESLIKEG